MPSQPDSIVTSPLRSASLLRWPAYVLGVLHREMHARIDSNLRDHWILSFVADAGGSSTVSQQDICDTLQIDRSEMVRLIDRLESDGLLERHRSDEDRRRYNITITPAGRARVRATDKDLQRANDDVFSALTDDELATMHTLACKAIGVVPPSA